MAYTSARLVPQASSAITYATPSGNYTSVNGGSYQYSGGSSAQDFSSQISNQINQALSTSRENSAFNAAEAQKQRDWASAEAEATRQFNMQEAAKNRDWQKSMSDTAHQREIADLMAAGLNPVLSAMNGNGASVGSGATASSSTPSGQSAQADTSANGAIASMLGSLLTAQTRLLEMTTSAETQRAVADKYTAAQELAALISADASKFGSQLSSAASIYGSDTHAAATRYSAERNLEAILGSANIHADATRYASLNSLQAALAMADANRYSADKAYQSHQDFPSNLYGAIGTLVNALGQGKLSSQDVLSSVMYGAGSDATVGAIGEIMQGLLGGRSWAEVRKALDRSLALDTTKQYESKSGKGGAGSRIK